VFFYPLVLSMVGFGLLFIALVFLRTGTEIRQRRTRALLARARRRA
jgi:heme exporter protein C